MKVELQDVSRYEGTSDTSTVSGAKSRISKANNKKLQDLLAESSDSNRSLTSKDKGKDP